MASPPNGLTHDMDVTISDEAADLVRAKGGTVAVDFIPPTT